MCCVLGVMFTPSQSSVLCPMCHFETPSMQLCLSHLRLVHGSDPRFSAQCGIEGCSYSARSFSVLYSHIYRRHPESGVITRRGHCVPLQVEPERSEVSEPSQVHQPSLPELQGNHCCETRLTSYMYVAGMIFFHRSKS